ncbi:hypothetical protein ABIE91_000572 [Bradyrhizobium elkanii]
MFDTAAAALRRPVSTRSTSAFRAKQYALKSRAAPSRQAESTALDYEGAKSVLGHKPPTWTKPGNVRFVVRSRR